MVIRRLLFEHRFEAIFCVRINSSMKYFYEFSYWVDYANQYGCKHDVHCICWYY